MDDVRYRAWMIRSWQAGGPDGGTAKMRIECIARGTVVELRGDRAADLEARVEEAFNAGVADEGSASATVAAGAPGRGAVPGPDAAERGGIGWTE